MKTLFASALLVLTLTTASISFADAPSPFRSAILTRADALKIDVVVEKSADTRLMVEFLDANGHTLAVQTVPKGDKVARTRFDIAELPDGHYLVVITDGTQTETKAVTLQTPTSVRTVAAL